MNEYIQNLYDTKRCDVFKFQVFYVPFCKHLKLFYDSKINVRQLAVLPWVSEQPIRLELCFCFIFFFFFVLFFPFQPPAEKRRARLVSPSMKGMPELSV